MRIISDFVDYYDLPLLQDSWPLYVRPERGSYSITRKVNILYYGGIVVGGVVGFCGKLYPYLRVYNKYIYNFKEAKRALPPFEKRKYFSRCNLDNIQALFNGHDHGFFRYPKYDDFLDEFPVFSVLYDSIEPNCRLMDMEFYRVFDNYTAHQMLDQYLTNLSNNDDVPQPIDDKTLSEAKGYNKWSFRNPNPPKRKQ